MSLHPLARLALLLGALLLAAPAIADDTEPTLEELLDATDDAQRGESSISLMEMHIKTARYERTMRMRAWSKGEEKTLIVVESPAKDAGTATLKVDDKIWNYLPKVDRTMKLPPGMMSGAWMGSHITNDDLVKESRMADDYTYELVGRPAEPGPEGVYEIALTPKPDAPVVWGKVTVRVRRDKIPVEVRYFDEDGAPVRTMRFLDVKELGGRLRPTKMEFVPEDKQGEHTSITYLELEIGADVPESTFSLQSLRR